jgi:hypothetical protein
MPKQDDKQGPNKAEHQRRAAEALRENLHRRKEQQRKQTPKPDAADRETGD